MVLILGTSNSTRLLMPPDPEPSFPGSGGALSPRDRLFFRGFWLARTMISCPVLAACRTTASDTIFPHGGCGGISDEKTQSDLPAKQKGSTAKIYQTAGVLILRNPQRGRPRRTPRNQLPTEYCRAAFCCACLGNLVWTALILPVMGSVKPSRMGGSRFSVESWCCRLELNQRPRPYQGRALPLSYGSEPEPRFLPQRRAERKESGVSVRTPQRRS